MPASEIRERCSVISGTVLACQVVPYGSTTKLHGQERQHLTTTSEADTLTLKKLLT